MEFSKKTKGYALYFGMAFMAFSIIATYLEGGSLLQKIFFLLTASGMGVTAYFHRQKMFIALQIVTVVGAVISFFNPTDFLRYFILSGSGLVAVICLIKINYIKEDFWWPIGGLGLLTLATGFATNAIAYPLFFNCLLAAAGTLVSVYSAIGFFHLKVRIAIIWLILNAVFTINPLRIIFSKVL